MELPKLNKDFTIKKDEITFQCKIVGILHNFDDIIIRVQILGKIEGGIISVEKEPKFIDVNPSWFG